MRYLCEVRLAQVWVMATDLAAERENRMQTVRSEATLPVLSSGFGELVQSVHLILARYLHRPRSQGWQRPSVSSFSFSWVLRQLFLPP
jgi:hypothetical protein